MFNKAEIQDTHKLEIQWKFRTPTNWKFSGNSGHPQIGNSVEIQDTHKLNSWVSQIYACKVNLWVSQIYSATRVQLRVANLIRDILDIVDTITGLNRYLGAVQCITIMPGRHVADLEEDARAGLIERPRSLPPKYFYDARGAELFGRICETPEYYPTRTEDALVTAVR